MADEGVTSKLAIPRMQSAIVVRTDDKVNRRLFFIAAEDFALQLSVYGSLEQAGDTSWVLDVDWRWDYVQVAKYLHELEAKSRATGHPIRICYSDSQDRIIVFEGNESQAMLMDKYGALYTHWQGREGLWLLYVDEKRRFNDVLALLKSLETGLPYYGMLDE